MHYIWLDQVFFVDYFFVVSPFHCVRVSEFAFEASVRVVFLEKVAVVLKG